MIINFKDKNQKNLIVYVVVITAVISFAISGAVFFVWNHFYPGSVTYDTSKVSTQNIRKFREVRDILDRNFYKSVDENKLLEGAIRGMAESLNDPYTVYLDKEQNKASNERIEGNYVGIGAILSPNDKEEGTIYEFFKGSPAKAAGLKVGDKILEVDGRDVSKSSNISAYLKGKENTNVRVTVYRPSANKKYEFTVTRKLIDIPCVNSEVLEGHVGYIRILIFDSKVNKEFEASLDSLLKKEIKGLIIDLRGNPGGYLGEVVKIADRLLPEGKIVYTIDRYKNKMVKKSDSKQLKLPLAVLVNGNSASASEILVFSFPLRYAD
ncbi:MAG TPA: S41 family peptidase, partial [Clostridia bacterium]|nr:S41 family peptidase [Clostridia bacterium]